MSDLTLFQSGHDELIELIEYREALVVYPAMTLQAQEASVLGANFSEPERLDTLKHTEEQIEGYSKRQNITVDGLYMVLADFEARAAIAEKEAGRVQDIADLWKRRAAMFEDMMLRTVQAMPGQKLQGNVHMFKLAACPASVEIARPDLVPEEYQYVRPKVKASLWMRLLATVMSRAEWSKEFGELIPEAELKAETSRSEIAEVLKCPVCRNLAAAKKKCQACEGSGLSKAGVPGCRLIQDKKRLVAE